MHSMVHRTKIRLFNILHIRVNHLEGKAVKLCATGVNHMSCCWKVSLGKGGCSSQDSTFNTWMMWQAEKTELPKRNDISDTQGEKLNSKTTRK